MADKALGVSIAASVDAPSTISSKPAKSERMQIVRQFFAWVALSTSLITAQAQEKAKVDAAHDAYVAACTVEATSGLASLKAAYDKSIASWIPQEKVLELNAKYQAKLDAKVDLCIQSAQADAKIAQADAKIAQADATIERAKTEKALIEAKITQADSKLAELNAQNQTLDVSEELWKKFDAELAAKQEFFTAFLEWKKTREEYNEMIAQLPKFIEQTQTYIAAARKAFQNHNEALARLDKLEVVLVKIAAHAPKGSVIISSL